nr:MAG TPA: hypothetical protein [Caudoviricetes sp.]
MSGAVSFVLGLLGLGAAGGINLGQSVNQKKEADKLARMYGWNETDVDIKKMRERVRKEWMSIPDNHPNCLGKWQCSYPSDKGLYYQTKYWFKDHLDAKGIPYDDVILDDVCGVNYEKLMREMVQNSGKKRR